MTREDFRFFERLRVRWAEIDAQQIVFNAHYLMYFDTAIAAYWRALALPYALTMAQLEGDLFVRKATVEYEASARYDDVLDVGVRCARIGNSSITFEGGAYRQDQRLVSCELVYVFADPATQTSRRVPQSLRSVLLGFERSEPMLDMRIGPWAALGAAAREIRKAVFVDEQAIPARLEWDDADAAATHAVAYNRLGLALATGRLRQEGPGAMRIGRMAAIRAARGSGVGRAVLDALLREAVGRGAVEVVVHAQQRVQSFYLRAGFVPRGPAFEEAGIAHIEMTWRT